MPIGVSPRRIHCLPGDVYVIPKVMQLCLKIEGSSGEEWTACHHHTLEVARRVALARRELIVPIAGPVIEEPPANEAL